MTDDSHARIWRSIDTMRDDLAEHRADVSGRLSSLEATSRHTTGRLEHVAGQNDRLLDMVGSVIGARARAGEGRRRAIVKIATSTTAIVLAVALLVCVMGGNRARVALANLLEVETQGAP